MKHEESIQREFSKQANRFGENRLTLSSKEHLAWMINILPLQTDICVLDVATGTGHLSRAIAPHVRQVIAMDMTPAMLKKATEEAARSNLKNILFEKGNASALRYEDASFDLVVSRLAIHHFERPEEQIKEMIRVCKPGHFISLIDLLSPDDLSGSESYNHLERLRDPSHTAALTKKQLIHLMETNGLTIQQIETRDVHVDFDQWIEMTETDQQTNITIRNKLNEELQGGAKTGMRPYLHDEALKFIQTWCSRSCKTLFLREHHNLILSIWKKIF